MNDFEMIHLDNLKEYYRKRRFVFAGIAARYCRNNNVTVAEQERLFPGLDLAVDEAAMSNDMLAVGCKLLALLDEAHYREMYRLAESTRDWYKLLQPWSGDNTRDARVLTALAKIFAFQENDVVFFADDFAFGRSKDGLFAISTTETFFVNEDGSTVSVEAAQKEEGILRGAKLYGNMVFDDDKGRVEVENVYIPEDVITATVNALEKRGISLIPLADVEDLFSTRETRKKLLRRSIQMRSGK